MFLINGVPSENYGAILEYGYKVTGAEVETSCSSSVSIVCFGQKIGRKKISASLLIVGSSQQIAYEKYTILCKKFAGIVELVLPDGAMYTSVLTGIGDEETLAPGKIRCSFKFEAIRHGPLQSVTGNRLICMSTLPKTDCKLTATVGASGSNYKLGSVIFPVVTAGEVLCVDGITKRILVNGVPAAQRAEWTQFPYLAPGENTIECVDPVTVEYYPGYF